MKHPDAEFICLPNALELVLSNDVRDQEWLKSMTTSPAAGDDTCSLFISADSKAKRNEWSLKLQEVIDRARMETERATVNVPVTTRNHFGKPALPPRKY